MWFFTCRRRDLLWRLEFLVSVNQDKINAVAAQLMKAKAEIIAAIDSLKEQIAAGETLDFTALDGLAQGLDDLNPDPEPEVPVEES